MAKTTPKPQVNNRFEKWAFSIITSKHFITILLIVLILLFVSLLAKSYYVFFDVKAYINDGQSIVKSPYLTQHVDKYIRELDIAGLLGGIVGILISFYITGVIEKGNAEKEIENRRLSEEITDKVTRIWNKESNFSPVDEIADVFNKILDIAKHSMQQGYQLYIMNTCTSFGYLLGFKVTTIINYHRTEKKDAFEILCDLNLDEYYDLYEKYELFRKDKLMELHKAGREFYDKYNKKPIYISLSTVGSDDQSPYTDFINTILDDSKIKLIFYDERDNKTRIGDLLKAANVTENMMDNLFLVPIKAIGSSNKNDYNEHKNKFVAMLTEIQSDSRKIMHNAKFTMVPAKEIFYQVFLNQLSGPADKGSCLFLLNNHQTIPNSGVKFLAFEIKNEKYINDTFIKIMESTAPDLN